MMTQPCGCTVALDPDIQVLRSVTKCQRHKRQMTEISSYGQDYYEKCGSVKSGAIQTANYLTEIHEALGEFPQLLPEEERNCLEVGGGVSPYCYELINLGYKYTGVESSIWACQFMKATYNVQMINTPLEDVTIDERFSLALAIHVLEHTQDPLLFLQQIYKLILPSGELFLIVPDDSDLVNPDHLWFFTQKSLFNLVRLAGFDIQKLLVRKYVKHENFPLFEGFQMILPSTEIHHRADFPLLCMMRNLIYCAEVGVDRGEFSEIFLNRHWLCDHYYGIDPYTPYPEKPYPREEAYLAAASRYAKFGYAELVRLSSSSAVDMFRDVQDKYPDCHRRLQFIYLDADHEYSAVKENINEWWPLLAEDGILAGHDFDITHPGVIQAVEEFANLKELNVHTTWSNGDAPCHSWYIYKNRSTHLFRRVQAP